MNRQIIFFVLLIICFSVYADQADGLSAEQKEMQGLETRISGDDLNKQEAPVYRRLNRELPEGGLLLIPESSNKRVLAFDPVTGDLVDENFILSDATNLSTPIQAVLGPDQNSILISDQVKDLVQQYDLDGNYLGVFAPAGGVNNSILDNIRGIAYHSNGNLLVSNAGGANEDCVAEFDQAGNYLGNFIANGEVDPFDVLYRESSDDYIVADIADPDYLKIFDTNGTLLQVLTDNVNFPEQVALAANGNILAACFSSPKGVHEYAPDGSLVGIYNPFDSGLRGVYELPNGNILMTDGDGVYEIDRSGNLVETKFSGASCRFITHVVQDSGPTGLYEDFENGEIPTDWQIINADGDDYEWEIYNGTNAHSGSWSVRIHYNSAGCDDWLITPQIEISDDYLFSVWANTHNSSYLEDFNVWASVNGGDFDILIDQVLQTPNEWTNYSYSLTDITGINSGDLVNIAVQCVSVDEYYLYLDDFYIGASGPNPNPVCAVNPIPSDLAVDVPIVTDVGWSYYHDPDYTEPEGFRIYMAYDEELTDAFITYVVYDGEGDYVVLHPIVFDPDTQYFWKVVPTTEAGRGDAAGCPVWSFTTAALDPDPVCAQEPFPADGAENVLIDSDIGWNYSHFPGYTEPEGFRIYMAYDEDLTDAFITYINYTGEGDYLLPHPIDFDYATQYFWKVVPTTENSRGDAEDCPVWSFTTEVFPDPVCATDPIPADDAVDVSVNASIGWTYTHDPLYSLPNGFRILMALDEEMTDAFESFVLYTGEGEYLIAHPITFDYETEYFWQVIPTTEASRGDAQNCPIWSFTTEDGISVDNNDLPPQNTILLGNYPNPFNPVTTIRFGVKEGENAVL
ncbi:MAG: choice-of-anchor J domain-containing protein, partial [Candidatus Cloacimonetes bacterium]|nr:choice-of-anchor J domain-containing protein [Candidatus Cloacimonadota bacterium]